MQIFYSNSSPLVSLQRFTRKQNWAKTRLRRSSDIELTTTSIKFLTSLWLFDFLRGPSVSKPLKWINRGVWDLGTLEPYKTSFFWITTCQEIGSSTNPLLCETCVLVHHLAGRLICHQFHRNHPWTFESKCQCIYLSLRFWHQQFSDLQNKLVRKLWLRSFHTG